MVDHLGSAPLALAIGSMFNVFRAVAAQISPQGANGSHEDASDPAASAAHAEDAGPNPRSGHVGRGRGRRPLPRRSQLDRLLSPAHLRQEPQHGRGGAAATVGVAKWRQRVSGDSPTSRKDSSSSPLLQRSPVEFSAMTQDLARLGRYLHDLSDLWTNRRTPPGITASACAWFCNVNENMLGEEICDFVLFLLL